MDDKKIFDYSKLKGKIIELYGTQSNFLTHLNMTEATFIKTMKNVRYFNQSEILIILNLFKLNVADIGDYFFSAKS